MAAGKNAMGIGEKQVFFFLSPLWPPNHTRRKLLCSVSILTLSLSDSLLTLFSISFLLPLFFFLLIFYWLYKSHPIGFVGSAFCWKSHHDGLCCANSIDTRHQIASSFCSQPSLTITTPPFDKSCLTSVFFFFFSFLFFADASIYKIDVSFVCAS